MVDLFFFFASYSRIKAKFLTRYHEMPVLPDKDKSYATGTLCDKFFQFHHRISGKLDGTDEQLQVSLTLKHITVKKADFFLELCDL